MSAWRHFTPFAFLALAPIGAAMGGVWTLTAAAATLAGLMGFDLVFGEEPEVEPAEPMRGASWPPRLYVMAQIAWIAWACAFAARSGTGLWSLAGLAVSTGVTTGVFGFVAAHELIHSRSPGDRALGLTLMGAAGYAHFRIAHVYGHHLRAATVQDPASARAGESLYRFLPRSIAGQVAEAWAFEAQRLRRAAKPVLSGGNRMIAYLAAEGALLLGVGLTSPRAFALLAAVAAIAVLLLESFNYVAHYGLTRRTLVGGRSEPLGPQHAWNTARRMNNAALFNMGHHGDHHRFAGRAYDRLEPFPGAPQLPAGYAGAILLALVPPLWRRVMDPRAQAVMAAAARQPGAA